MLGKVMWQGLWLLGNLLYGITYPLWWLGARYHHWKLRRRLNG